MKPEFIVHPNLPKKEVTTVIVSSQSKELLSALDEHGISVLQTEVEPMIQGSTAHHADMLSLHLGSNKIALASSQKKLAKQLLDLGFDVETYSLGSKYPQDCRLNSLIIDNQLIIGKNNELINEISKKISNILNIKRVPQGYVKCSTAIVNANSVISSDLTIKKACEDLRIECLTIPCGEILLEGYDYGFIGGCCFKKNAETLAFTGKVSAISSYEKIKAFCDKQNVKIIELTSEELFDIGGVLPILERLTIKSQVPK